MDCADALLLGYAPMDRLHAGFVTLVQALAQAPDDSMAATLDALLRDAQLHFGTEDRWMTETAFPARACHMHEHAAVMGSIEGVRRRIARAEPDAGDAVRRLAAALIEWFPGHAQHLDSALAHWMCRLRWGGVPVVLRRPGGAPFAAAIR